jgi:hypothetical protein
VIAVSNYVTWWLIVRRINERMPEKRHSFFPFLTSTFQQTLWAYMDLEPKGRLVAWFRLQLGLAITLGVIGVILKVAGEGL